MKHSYKKILAIALAGLFSSQAVATGDYKDDIKNLNHPLLKKYNQKPPSPAPASPSWLLRGAAWLGGWSVAAAMGYGVHAALESYGVNKYLSGAATAAFGYWMGWYTKDVLSTFWSGTQHELSAQIKTLTTNENGVEKALQEVDDVRTTLTLGMSHHKNNDAQELIKKSLDEHFIHEFKILKEHCNNNRNLVTNGQLPEIKDMLSELRSMVSGEKPRVLPKQLLSWCWKWIQRLDEAVARMGNALYETVQVDCLGNFSKDPHVLKTWGGWELEEAVHKLIQACENVYLKDGTIKLPKIADEDLKQFSQAAIIIIKKAEKVLASLCRYRHALERIDLGVNVTRFCWNITDKSGDAIADGCKKSVKFCYNHARQHYMSYLTGVMCVVSCVALVCLDLGLWEVSEIIKQFNTSIYDGDSCLSSSYDAWQVVNDAITGRLLPPNK